MIQYIEQSLFDTNFNEGNSHTIAHVVNDKGIWGAGFVVPLGKKYPIAKKDYQNNTPRLGEVLYTLTEDHNILAIAHMCAQTLGGKRPLFYNHLVHCMEDVAQFAQQDIIHCPLFGAGLAGGDWFFIHELIKDIWSNNDVNIYWLPDMLPQFIDTYDIIYFMKNLKEK